MLSFFGAIFLGWSLGANDASNIFGTAVASRMIKFWTAAILASIFLLLGALLEGQAGIRTLQGLTHINTDQALACTFSAAATVSIMTVFGLPVLGIGIIRGIRSVKGRTFLNIIFAWSLTPAVVSFIAIAIDFVIHLQYVPKV